MYKNAAEDTFLKMKNTLNCRGRILDLSTPLVMGIINMTPDSFYDGGKIKDEKALLSQAEIMLRDGASILDIGGQSTRPWAEKIDAETEWKRIEKAITCIHQHFPDTIISVDTFYADVAKNAILAGASIINDVSGGSAGLSIYEIAAQYSAPYILMHTKGNPQTMQDDPTYIDVIQEVMQFFIEKCSELKNAGVNDIIIDPGFGFGKTTQHNYTLLKNLGIFKITECPVLAGLSRKSMITKILNVKNTEALNGTTVLNTIALMNGATLLRVHDVKEATECIRLYQNYNQA